MKTSLIAVLASLVPACLPAAADFDVRDETEFKRIVPPNAKLAQLATGLKFTEGPVWLAHDGGYLVFSDDSAAGQGREMNAKFQSRVQRAGLKFGHWSFFGVWCLVLGVSTDCSS